MAFKQLICPILARGRRPRSFSRPLVLSCLSRRFCSRHSPSGPVSRLSNEFMTAFNDGQFKAMSDLCGSISSNVDFQSKFEPADSSSLVTVYNKKIFELICKRHYHRVTPVFCEMLESRVFPDKETFTHMISFYTKMKAFSQVKGILEMMSELKIPRSIAAINDLLRAYAEEGMLKEAVMEWNYMLDNRIEPSIETLEHFIKVHGVSGDIFGALKLFSKLFREFRLEPSSDTHAMILELLLLSGKTDLVICRFEAMKRGELPAPGTRALNVILDLHRRQNDIQSMEKTFESIRADFGLRPTDKSYECLILAYCESRKYSKILSIFKEMAVEKIVPNSNSISTALRTFTQSKDVHSAENILFLSLQAGAVPDYQHFVTLVFLLCKIENNPERALAYCLKFKKDYQLTPNQEIYVHLIFGYGKNQELAKVLRLYRKMILEDKLSPTPLTFVALLIAYINSSKFLEAANLLDNPGFYGIDNANRHLFAEISTLFRAKNHQAIHMLQRFDWTKLKGPGVQKEELEKINQMLCPST